MVDFMLKHAFDRRIWASHKRKFVHNNDDFFMACVTGDIRKGIFP